MDDATGHRLWTEADQASLLDKTSRPHLQCHRDPPCIHLEYLTPERCKATPSADDWPTYAAGFNGTEGECVLRNIVREWFDGKVVAVFGDSVNDHVRAFLHLRLTLCHIEGAHARQLTARPTVQGGQEPSTRAPYGRTALIAGLSCTVVRSSALRPKRVRFKP